MTIPAVIYGAKSTEDKHDSIPTQFAEAREMAEENGWTVVGVFQDEGFSAYSRNRGPGLESAKRRAVEAATEHGTTAMLIAQAHDRFARGAGDKPGAPQSLGEIWHEMRRCDVWLRTVEDDFDLRDPASVAAIGHRAHVDSRRKSKAVKKGMRRRAERGHHNGGRSQFGYQWAGPKGERVLAIYEPEAIIVIHIFEEFVAGRSQRQIAIGLSLSGVRTQRNAEWYQGTVKRIIENPIYKGCVRLHGREYDGQHPAIVSTELWERARLLRAAMKEPSSKGRGRKPKAQHLLTYGMLRCGKCGGAMIPRTDTRRGTSEYRCFRRNRLGPDACGQDAVSRERVDSAVMEYFDGAVLDIEATRREIETAIGREASETRELRDQAERDERKAVEDLARIRRNYREGRLDADDWQSFSDEIEPEIEAARAKLARLEEHERHASEKALPDAEAEMMRMLANLRAAIVGEVRDAAGIDAVRAALRRIFVGFTLRRLRESYDRDVFDVSLMGVGGGYELQPQLREDAISDYGPSSVTPKPRRVPLSRAGNKESNGFGL